VGTVQGAPVDRLATGLREALESVADAGLKGGGGRVTPAQSGSPAGTLTPAPRKSASSLRRARSPNFFAAARLLETLRAQVSADVGEEQFRELDILDQAELLRRALSSGVLAERVASATSLDRYALPHALLASLGCREAVTTNFDTLYEHAMGSSCAA